MSMFAAAVAWWSPSPLLLSHHNHYPCCDCHVVATIPTGPHCYCNCCCWCIVAALREEEFTWRGGGALALQSHRGWCSGPVVCRCCAQDGGGLHMGIAIRHEKKRKNTTHCLVHCHHHEGGEIHMEREGSTIRNNAPPN